jgi:drug/metabolite transporter (DMT)-like permease
LLASAGAVVTKVGVDYVRPVPFSAARFAGGAICVLILASLRGHSLRRVPRLAVLLPAALLGLVANSLAFTFGLRLSTAVDISLIVGLAPVLTALIVMAIARRPPPWQQIVALPLGFLGVVAVVGPSFSGGGHAIGDFVALGMPLTWALFLVIIADEAAAVPATVLASWMMLIGLVALGPVALLQTLDGRDNWTQALIPIIISGVLATGLVYAANLWCLPRIGSTGTAVYGYLQPPFGAIAAAVILHEAFGPFQILGAVIILGSAFLANWKSVTRTQRPGLSGEVP